jgi:hypothetical protein
MRPTITRCAFGFAALAVVCAAGAMPPPDLVLPASAEPQPASAGQLAFRPGLWEIRHEAKGGPMSDAPQLQQKCFDARALDADAGAPLKVPRTEGGRRGGPRCSFGEVQVFEGQFTLPARCQGPMGAISIDWAGTHGAERFEMAGQMRMGPMSMQMRVEGRRTGECLAP